MSSVGPEVASEGRGHSLSSSLSTTSPFQTYHRLVPARYESLLLLRRRLEENEEKKKKEENGTDTKKKQKEDVDDSTSYGVKETKDSSLVAAAAAASEETSPVSSPSSAAAFLTARVSMLSLLEMSAYRYGEPQPHHPPPNNNICGYKDASNNNNKTEDSNSDAHEKLWDVALSTALLRRARLDADEDAAMREWDFPTLRRSHSKIGDGDEGDETEKDGATADESSASWRDMFDFRKSSKEIADAFFEDYPECSHISEGDSASSSNDNEEEGERSNDPFYCEREGIGGRVAPSGRNGKEDSQQRHSSTSATRMAEKRDSWMKQEQRKPQQQQQLQPISEADQTRGNSSTTCSARGDYQQHASAQQQQKIALDYQNLGNSRDHGEIFEYTPPRSTMRFNPHETNPYKRQLQSQQPLQQQYDSWDMYNGKLPPNEQQQQKQPQLHKGLNEREQKPNYHLQSQNYHQQYKCYQNSQHSQQQKANPFRTAREVSGEDIGENDEGGGCTIEHREQHENHHQHNHPVLPQQQQRLRGPKLSAGLKRKFQPPCRKQQQQQPIGTQKRSAKSSPSLSGGGVTARPSSMNSQHSQNGDDDDDDDLPEALRGLDKELIDKIQNEILVSGDPVTFDDIAGLADAKQAVLELVCWPMKRPDLFTGLRRGPNGLLLFGPPGTGKTLIGKAIAHESGATFFSISSSSLTSKWIGEGEKLVRTLFAVATVNEPAVVFIDEIDSLLTQRKADENEASRRIKTEFLVQLDGTGTSGQGRVLVIGATNRPHELDDAARRRFVKRLYIPLPEQGDRKVLLETLLVKNNHNLSTRDINHLSKDTEGFSGADLKALCTDAALGPIRQLGVRALTVDPEDVPPISLKHFKKALRGMKPSVAPSDLKVYLEWNDVYGSKINTEEEGDDGLSQDESEGSDENNDE